MKFEPETAEGVNLITRHDGGRIWVGAVAHATSLLVPWQGAVREWALADFAALAPADLEPLLALAPEIVLLGSGARLRFPHPRLLRALHERRIGVETMDTAAACRTYNVLAGEKRRVVAALVLQAPAPAPPR